MRCGGLGGGFWQHDVKEQSRSSSSLSDPRLMDSSPESKSSPVMSLCSATRQASGSSWSASGAIGLSCSGDQLNAGTRRDRDSLETLL